MRRSRGLLLPLLIMASAACAWGLEGGGEGADDWTGTAEQKIFGLSTIWAEAKYAFPSFGQVPDLDWDRSFREFIPRVVAASDKDEYYWILMEFAGLLKDGHTSVLPPWGYLRPDYDNPPLEVQVVEGAFLIARMGETPELTGQDIRVGLEIVQVDGVGARRYFEDSVNRYYPRGSAHANDAVNIVYILRGPRDSKVTLRVRDASGDEREVSLTRNSALAGGQPFLPRILLWMLSESSLEIKHLPGGIEYVRIANFQDPAMGNEFLVLVDGLDEETTTGLLIDLRFCLGGRSEVAEQMIGALIDAPVSSPLWKYPKYVAAETNWGRPPEWGTADNTIAPREGKRFMGPVTILTAGTASSTAEDFAISLREAGRAVLVGERTAGSAGNPISLPLPGGGRFEMATFRAYLPDGREYVGLGLEPDVAIAPTRQDIRTGADAVMEKGLEVLAGWDSYRRRSPE